MIEDTNNIWLNADSFSCKDISFDTDKMLNVNLVLSDTTTASKVKSIINKLRLRKYGFEKSFCKIIVHSTPNVSQEVIDELSRCDEYVPQIFISIIINDTTFLEENIISKLHTIYKKLSIAKLHQEYTFILVSDMTYAKRMLYIMGKFKSLIMSYDNNAIEINCDVSPQLIAVSGSSFVTAQSSIDNIIYGLIDELPKVSKSRTCGMVSIIYYIALIKEMQYKYDGIDINECLKNATNNNYCYYKCDNNHANCLECINKYMQLMPKDLGQASKYAKEFLSEKQENDELKILEADWDYIV